jgi:hypothetical protein
LTKQWSISHKSLGLLNKMISSIKD